MEEANEDATAEALRNEVIIRQIFKNLPTSTLVSCSRVNQLWKTEARSFIRDNRECAVRIGFYSNPPMCEKLREFERVLEDMTIIPFNSLHILVTNHRCYEDEPDMTATNLMTRFPLKFLSVVEYAGKSSCGTLKCPAAPLILKLIRKNSSVLLELEIRRGGKYFGSDGLFCSWKPPQFENLKKLSIESGSTISSKCVKQLIQGAPNLKEIHGNCLNKIAAVPDNKFDTLKRLAFDIDDLDQLEQFADRLDHLEELVVDVGNGIYYADDPITLRFYGLFKKLLTLNAMTLGSLGVRCKAGFLVNQLGLSQMPSVRVFCISVKNLTRSLPHIMAIDFPQLFPNLRKVNIREDKPTYYEELYGDLDVIYYEDDHGNVVPYEENDGNAVPEEDIDDDTIPQDILAAPNASETTLELVIDANIRNSELLELRKLFPNLLSFAIQGRYKNYFPPMGVVGKLWPNLEGLRVKTECYTEEFDTEVFGLNEEELELLCRQDIEFLKTVQIVPCRPCVGTMKKLKDLTVECLLPRSESRGTRTVLELVQGLIGRKPDFSFKRKQVGFTSYWSRPRFKEIWEDVYPYDLRDWGADDESTTTEEESEDCESSTEFSEASCSTDESNVSDSNASNESDSSASNASDEES